MRVLRDDRHWRRDERLRREHVSGMHFVLMFAAVGLITLSRIDHPLTDAVRQELRRGVAPVLSTAGNVLSPLRRSVRYAGNLFHMQSELERLNREVAELAAWKNRADRLTRSNEALRRQVRAVGDGEVPFITASVLTGPRGPLGRAVTLAAGRVDGVRYGQPVIGHDGLIGRVVAVADSSCRVLLLNDLNSRIPVEVGKARVAALAIGDNTPSPRLIYLEKSGVGIRTGDLVLSSGSSGEFPRGLKLGQVIVRDGVVRIRPTNSLVPGAFLSVLLYKLPSILDGETTRKQRLVSNPGRTRK